MEENATQSTKAEEKSDNKARGLLLIVGVVLFSVGFLMGSIFTGDTVIAPDEISEPSMEEEIPTDETLNTTSQENISGLEQTEFVAEVGKFTLTLPSEYVVLKGLDGPFEGGPATILEIGKASDDGTNVVDTFVGVETKLTVYPIEGWGTSFEDFVQNRLDSLGTGQKTQQDSVTVSGAQASVYISDGLFDSRHIYWASDDSYFHLRGPLEDNEVLGRIVGDVLEGISFN